jgi:hypothetical protein
LILLATEQRASAALQAMITDEHLTVAAAVQGCARAISREATRLRHHNKKIKDGGTTAVNIR